ncbi:MAG: extracellular solute-binding protein, partial [Clostridiales bacterium]|nr:extracellular solute-binding protein [Clostridiales bacterium]
TLKLISVQQDWATASPEDHYIWAFFKEYCNLDLDVTYYQGGSWAEQRNLVFTGGDLPDIFYQCGFSTSDMVRYGQGEGLLHPLEDLIEQYAPLIKMAIEANPNILLETKTPDGHMYCIPRITAEYVELNTVRMFINKAWLDQGGLKMPSTLDDLTEVLRYFRDGDPNGNGEADEIPWLGTAGGTGTVVLTALGMNTNSSLEIFVKSDGKTVSSPPLEDNYIHYLTYMKQLMDEGLFNSDFYTMSTEQVNATLARNIVGL